MTIRYKCEECGAALNIKDELAGTSGHCPKCKAEFVVPKPEKASPGGEEARKKQAVSSKSKGAADDESVLGGSDSANAGNLSDDDIENILEGKDEPESDGAYGIAEKEAPRPAARHVSSAPDSFDDDDDDVFADARPSQREQTPTPPPQPAVSVSNLARDLMARGEKPAQPDRGREKSDQRTGKLFGGGQYGDDDEGFTSQEKLLYFLKIGGPILGVLVLVFLLSSWYLSRWRKGDLPDLAPVTGIVTLDGKPVPKALVQFIPMATDPAKFNVYGGGAAAGYTDEQGRYTLHYTSVAGAPIGKHLVRIEASDKDGRPIIPAQYSSSVSTLRQDVKPGNNEINLDLVSTQPSRGKPNR